MKWDTGEIRIIPKKRFVALSNVLVNLCMNLLHSHMMSRQLTECCTQRDLAMMLQCFGHFQTLQLLRVVNLDPYHYQVEINVHYLIFK